MDPAEERESADHGPAATDPEGLDDFEATGFSLAEATGGPLGIAEATVPFLAFTITWTATGNDVVAGGIVAVAVAAVLAGARLLRRETTQFAFSGLIGVAIGAFVAARTGEAKNFFLPGILINIGSCSVYLISIAVRRPLIGLLAAAFTGEGSRWHADPERRALYTRASWIWVALFAFRLCVQVPLYVTDSVGTLAIARVITGLPLFALGLWLTYLLLRPVLGEQMLKPSRRPG